MFNAFAAIRGSFPPVLLPRPLSTLWQVDARRLSIIKNDAPAMKFSLLLLPFSAASDLFEFACDRQARLNKERSECN